ncbi:MAG: RluA family pseudouridine synthase [Lachnospiraceae bacterium]|nr:RluA family pseudouridine synthase [Lachnospiraceae bacterium]
MRTETISETEAGQRLDKYLHRFLPEAGKGFIYKMLRKKNIVLNGKRAEGGERVKAGDEVAFYLAAETIEKFRRGAAEARAVNGVAQRETLRPYDNETSTSFRESFRRLVRFENEHIIIVDKPVGLLCQKAQAGDVSLNEWLRGYLPPPPPGFTPAVLNRLDRNTGGLVFCGKTLRGSQEISRLLRGKGLRKYYLLLVAGRLAEAGELRGLLAKDGYHNKVSVTLDEDGKGKGAAVVTRYKPLKVYANRTLVEAELVTGKSHQLRAHFAALGHPVLGDYKYGDRRLNDECKRRYGVESQLLYAYRVVFPPMEEPLADMSGLEVVGQVPEVFGYSDTAGGRLPPLRELGDFTYGDMED